MAKLTNREWQARRDAAARDYLVKAGLLRPPAPPPPRDMDKEERRRAKVRAEREARIRPPVEIPPDAKHGAHNTYRRYECRCRPCSEAAWASNDRAVERDRKKREEARSGTDN